MKQITISIPTQNEIKYELMVMTISIRKLFYRLEDFIFDRSGKTIWILLTKLGFACPHFPVLGNKKSWLWNTTYKRDSRTDTCSVCGYQTITKIKNDPIFRNYAQIGRQADMDQLYRSYKTATNETERTAIKKSISQITHEDKKVKSMRESLIKATRGHEHDQIKEVHDFVASHKAYRNV